MVRGGRGARRSRGEMVGGEEIRVRRSRTRRSRTRRSRGEEIGARFGVVDNDVVMVGFVVGERSSKRRRESRQCCCGGFYCEGKKMRVEKDSG